MNQLDQHIEALVFCSEQSLGLDEIAASLKLSYGWELKDEEILAAIETIRLKYADESFPFELVEISEGFQFLTKKEFHPTVNALIQHKAKKKLSVAQMETLSIIAYKQPISKSEVEHLRGVNCDYAVQKLLEKELISISGKSDGPGRPILYSTSESFMDYFGIKSVKDLPQLKDIHIESNEIGQPAESVEMSATAEVVISEEMTNHEPDSDTSSEIALEEEGISIGDESTSDVAVLSELSDTVEEREILSPEAEHGHLDESDIQVRDRKQIYMENQEEVFDRSGIEEPQPDQGDLHA